MRLNINYVIEIKV